MTVRRAAAALLMIALAAGASAQNTDIEALSGLKFNFGNPGARALAMGGAFIGLADDASAAETNPAGLTILRKKELSLEARQTITSQNFVTGGDYPYITSRDFPSEQTSITFASVVVPFRNGAVALYHHKPLEFRNSVDILDRYATPRFYLGPGGPVSRDDCPNVPGCTAHQIYPYHTSADVELSTFGAALAWQHGDFSIGGAVRHHQFRENASTYRVDLDAVGTPTFLVSQTNGNRLFGKNNENDVTWVAGVKWAPTQKFSAGAVYKKGATFPAPVSAGIQRTDRTADLTVVGITDFHTPDSAGVGVSYRPTPNLTLNADVIRVGYSNLTDRFISVIEFGTEDAGGVEALAGYESHDGTEAHFGVEYFILWRVPVALRAGWWRDPAHAIHFQAPLLTPHDIAASILFPDSAAENHYSVGFGLSLPRFQIDAGYDTSESLKQASVSFVARF